MKKNFVDLLKENYGDEVVELSESTLDINKLEFFSTGSASLDIALGRGGIPAGRISVFYGPESSGKTTLSLTTARNVLKKGYKVLYVDVENSLDFNYIQALIGDNFDPDHFILVQPEYAEDALTICEKGIQSNEFKLIVLDSVGALAPKKEKEDDFEKAHVAIVPRMLAAFLRRNMYAIRTQNIALLFINQVRSLIGSYIPQDDMPGGNVLKHLASIVVYMHKSTPIKSGEDVIGSYTKFVVKKNKLAPPFKSFKFPLIYGKGVDYTRDIVELAEIAGILLKKGSYYVYDGVTIAQGMQNTITYLENNPETLDKIIKSCYNKDVHETLLE